jgi:hypothetical protein
MSLLCPKCNYPQYCPCDSCKCRNVGELKWVYSTDFAINPVNKDKLLIDVIICGNCGLKMSGDQWLEEEIKQTK